MSKVLRVAAVVVGATALLVATGGLAAVGIGTGATAGTAATATAAATAGTAASLGGLTASTLTLISGGLSVAANLTAKRPSTGGSATQFKADPGAAIPYMMGRTFNAGNIIYRRTHNTVGYRLPDLQSFVVVLSGGGPVEQIERFTSDGATVTFNASGNAVGGFASWMFQRTQLGAAPQTTALTVGTGGITTSAPPGWNAASKLSGFAAALWTVRYDLKSKIFSQGLPQPGWVVRGVRCYDPRLDSTYPGGSGACRALNEATYVYTENPYLHGLTFALGRYQNGKRVLGVGAPLVGIDVAAFVEGANVADENEWKVGGLIYSTDNKWQALKTILQAGGGEPIHLGAKLSCIVNAPKVTLATLSEADLAGGERSVIGTQPRRDRINRIIPRYRSEAHGWQIIPAAPVVVAAHVTADGGERTKEVTYPLVQQLKQLAELARYDIENAREYGPIVLPLKLRGLGYKPGDQLVINLPEIGLNNQAVLVTNRELDVETGTVTLIARSENTGKHAFALGQTTTAPPTPSLTAPPAPPAPPSGAWAIAASGLSSGANVTPIFRVDGATGVDPVDAVVFEYRVTDVGNGPDDGWILAGLDPPSVVSKIISPVLSATSYQIAVSYRLGTVIGSRLILGPQTSATAGTDWNGVTGGGRPENGAVTGDNLQINSRMEAGLDGYNAAGFAMARVEGINNPPQKWVLQSTAASNANEFQFPRFPVVGGRKIYISLQVMRTAALTDLRISANEFRADTGAGIGPVGGTQVIIPTATGVWQRFEYEGTLSGGAGFMQPSIRLLAGNGGTVQVAALTVSYAQPGADTTATNQTLLHIPNDQIIQANSAGSVLAGQLPRPLKASFFLGGADVSSGTTWSLDVAAAVATISTTGQISLLAQPASGRIKVTGVRSGVTLTGTFLVATNVAAVPGTPSGGGTAQTFSSFTSTNSTSFVQVGAEQTVSTGSVGTLTATGSLGFSAVLPDNQFARAELKWQYRTPVGSGTWTDFGPGIRESGAAFGGVFNDPEQEPEPSYPGAISANQTSTGPAASTSYGVRLVARSLDARTIQMFGSATVAGS